MKEGTSTQCLLRTDSMRRIGILTLILYLASPLTGQNLLLEESFAVMEEHKLSGFSEQDSAIAFSSGSWMPHYYSYSQLNNTYLADELWKQLGTNQLSLLIFPFDLLEDASFDFSSVSENADLNRLYGIEDGNLTGIDPRLRSCFTLDRWNFSSEKFRLEKQTLALAPVAVFSKNIKGDSTKKKYDRIVIGLLPYPEKLHRKYDRSRMHRNLIQVKELSYEFKMLDEDWLRELDLEYPYWDFELPSPFFLENSSQWNETSWKLFIDRIFEEMEEGKGRMPGSAISAQVDIETIHKNLFNEEFPARYWKGISGEDNEQGEKEKWMKADLKERCYSMVFREKWYLDPETLYLKKNVVSVSPVYWKIVKPSSGNSGNEGQKNYPEYERIPLFIIPFD